MDFLQCIYTVFVQQLVQNGKGHLHIYQGEVILQEFFLQHVQNGIGHLHIY